MSAFCSPGDRSNVDAVQRRSVAVPWALNFLSVFRQSLVWYNRSEDYARVSQRYSRKPEEIFAGQYPNVRMRGGGG
jgi:hypothetical protein